MNCNYCKRPCIKKGKRKNGIQKYRCTRCGKYQQKTYLHQAWMPGINEQIKTLVKESCGIRSISRVLNISSTTVIHRIRQIASRIIKPKIRMGKEYEVDELKTYRGRKTRERWLVYALSREDGQVVDYRIGRRTKRTLGAVVETLLLSKARKIFTDKFQLYKYLIPLWLHRWRQYAINHIERMNLNLRNGLKRLGRKTLCFSKSDSMLEACVKIYFWG